MTVARSSSGPLGELPGPLAAFLMPEGDSWDVGYAALFLCSDEARWINGVVLPVDAGLLTVTPVTYNTISGQARF